MLTRQRCQRNYSHPCPVPRNAVGYTSLPPASLHAVPTIAGLWQSPSCWIAAFHYEQLARARAATLGVSGVASLSTEDALASRLMVKVKEPHDTCGPESEALTASPALRDPLNVPVHDRRTKGPSDVEGMCESTPDT